MNKKELIEFLLDKPGYLKEGANRLAKKTGVDPDVCLEALREARRMVNEEDEVIEGMILKSRWQTPNGEWRESYVNDKKANNNDEIKALLEKLVQDLKEFGPRVKVDTPPSEGNVDKFALEICLPDFHFGKNDGLSIEEQANLYVNTVGEIINRASSYSISEIILPIGNDLLNSEGMRKSTTKGTPQDDNTDWMTSFRTAWLAVVQSIEMLSEVASVSVINVLGNHDYERSFYIGELIDAYFTYNDRVSIINSGSDRVYLTYGMNLLGYTHGDTIKPADLPLIMATEMPVEFANSNTRSWRLGHLHKHKKDEYRGIEVEYLPSLCGSDKWHLQQGYHSDPKAMAYVWDFKGGKVGFIQLNEYVGHD